jgi:ribonuclease BN (tRNA processing enzyme)
MTHVQLTPIGTSPAWYNPGEPTSGFLLEADGYRVLIDCGSGVISRYLSLSTEPIDAIVLTHGHADHVLDLVPLAYGIQYGALDSWRPRLLVPRGVRARLSHLVGAWDGPADFFETTYDVADYATGVPFELGPFRVDSCEVPHFIETWALRFEHEGGSFGYTADLGPSEGAAAFLRDVDLLLTEATLPVDHGEAADNRGHLTAEEAGQLAAAAGAGALLLTHVPVELGFEDVRARAAGRYPGPISIARSGEPVAIAPARATSA